MVIFKGTNFRSVGIIVDYLPKIAKAKKKINTYQVEGRNGFLSIDTGAYEPFSLTLECHCSDTADLNVIKDLLDGYGTLSFDNETEYTAIINSQIPFEQVQMFKRFQVTFLVNPIREDIATTTLNLLGISTFEIESYTIVYPTISITCSGDVSISINNHTFYLNDTNDTYTLDCKNKVIVDSNGNNASSLMQYDFPSFVVGQNTIGTTGTITTLTANYKNTYF